MTTRTARPTGPPAAELEDEDARVLAQVNEVRLSRNWSINRLAIAMDAAGYPMEARTLARLLRRPYVTRGRDRSIYRLRRFLDWVYLQAEQKDQRRAELEDREIARRREREVNS